MNDVPFHMTRMGQRYYEHTLPELVRQVARLADVLQELTFQSRKRDDRPDSKLDSKDT